MRTKGLPEIRDLPALGIELVGVRKSFGHLTALAGVDLEIPQGSSVAIMGPNGAGKSTLLKIVTGLAAPTKGVVRLAGVDLRRAGPGLRALIGLVAHESMLYADLTARENLRFHAKLYGLRSPDEAIEATAERLAVTSFLDRPVRGLSRGMRQRVSIARALLHEPRVLVLDEPYTGLDEVAARSLAALLSSLHTPERTLLIATHEIARACAGTQRVIVLNRGRVAMDRPIAEENSEADLAGAYVALLEGSRR